VLAAAVPTVSRTYRDILMADLKVETANGRDVIKVPPYATAQLREFLQGKGIDFTVAYRHVSGEQETDMILLCEGAELGDIQALLDAWRMPNPPTYTGAGSPQIGDVRASGTGFITFQSLAERLTLVVQSVIIPGDRTKEGVLVESVSIVWRELLKLIQADPTIIHQINDRKWEEILAASYSALGFEEVTLTPRSGDFGRDVIAVKRGFGTIRILDQMKAYSQGYLVTANDVRALAGVVLSDPRASKGVVTTTSDFAPRIMDEPNLKDLIPYRLELVNGEKLVQRVSDLATKG
jgi:restriction system protein